VIVLDANLLLYAYDSAVVHHAAARRWIEQTFSEPDPVGLPLQTISAFLRIMTNSRLPGQRFTVEEAVEIVDHWLAQPNVRLLTVAEHSWPLFRKTLLAGRAQGPLVSDAQLVALTMEHGGVLYTTDRDFARFPDLRWVNPLT
jgi:uncharacterized protein